jgi:hypothetical protein
MLAALAPPAAVESARRSLAPPNLAFHGVEAWQDAVDFPHFGCCEPEGNMVDCDMSFDADERRLLGELADVLIPAGEGFPSASEAGVAGDGLDRVLSFRPDLADGLKRLIAAAQGHSATEFVAETQRDDPARFALLAEFVPGAYFLNPRVREKLGYAGQGGRPIDPRTDYLDDGLLQSVIDRGTIYRPTPDSRGAAVSEGPAAAATKNKGR